MKWMVQEAAAEKKPKQYPRIPKLPMALHGDTWYRARKIGETAAKVQLGGPLLRPRPTAFTAAFLFCCLLFVKSQIPSMGHLLGVTLTEGRFEPLNFGLFQFRILPFSIAGGLF